MSKPLTFTWDMWIPGKTDEEIIARALEEAADPDAQVIILQRADVPDIFTGAKVEITQE